MLDPQTRARIAVVSGTVGGNRNVAKHGGHAVAAPARAGFQRRFELQVDPDGKLTPDERTRRAHHAMKAHMAELSLRSAQRRSRA